MKRGFLWSLRCLSALPFGQAPSPEPERPVALALWFPVVGAVLGALSGTVTFWSRKAFPPSLAAATGLTVHVLLTGALHLDGLADTADGVFGGWTRERRLEIMRDSRIGTFGVLALILILLTKFAALSFLCNLDDRSVVWTAWLAAGMVSRYAMVLSASLAPYARSGPGTGRSFIERIRPGHALVSTFLVLALFAAIAASGLALFHPRAWIFMLTLPMALTVLLTLCLRRKLGGLTGDTLGAVGECTEAVMLAAATCLFLR